MTKLLLPYNKTILKTNIIFSVFLAFISTLVSVIFSKELPPAENPINSIFQQGVSHYIFWILTGGFILSVYYFEVARNNEYYFYYNLGLGKMKLIILTYTLHLLFIGPLLYLLKYV